MFIHNHLPTFDEQRGVEKRQVISMQMPPLPDQRHFYRALLFQIDAPHSRKLPLVCVGFWPTAGSHTLSATTADSLKR